MADIGNIVKGLGITALFFLACFTAVLYGMGKFDFIFIKRDLPISGKGNAVIEVPDMPEGDKKLEDHVSNLGIGDNLSGITSAQDKEGEETKSEDGEKNDNPTIPEEYYPSLEQAISSGYEISTNDYTAIGDKQVIAEIILDIAMTRDQIKGEKNITVDAPVIYEDGGEYFYAVGKEKAYRFSFETYMEYILVNDKTTVTVYTADGREVSVYGHSELIPAYVRDSAGNPLFIDGDGRYFHLDEAGRKLYSSYLDATDSIGLYFNYDKSFGKSDNPLNVYRRNKDVYFMDEIDMSDFYIRSSIDPSLAYSIYKIRPAYAEKVANYNPRFALALAEIKRQIEEDKRLEEEKRTELLTSEPDPVISPESESVYFESDAYPEGSDTEIISDILAEDIVTELDSAEDTREKTELQTETETEIETETTRGNITSSDPNILIIERTLNLARYGYGYASDDREAIDYKYAKAYEFSEGRAAVVDDKGVLRFINPLGEVVIDGSGTKMVTSSRYITSEYAEPLYRHSENSKGYLYFDNGLVRVRKLERDYTFRNLIYSDSDVLLYADGSEFEIPHGYTLVSYSDGVLVLKGQNGKFGYYHKDGYWIAQPIYTEIRPFSEGLGVIGFLGGKKGVIDKNGNIVIPFSYEYITAPSCGIITVYSYENGWRILVKTEKQEA